MGGLSVEREVSLRSGENCFRALASLGYDVVRIDALQDVGARLIEAEVDVAFLALHGRYGEDGTIQGLLDIMGIPYTGSGVLASALGMHKIAAKKVVAQSGVPTPSFYEFGQHEDARDATAAIVERLGMPVMVKPVQEGSSLGVAKCADLDTLEECLESGRRQFGQMFVEQFIAGREITVGVLERSGVLQVLPTLELVPKNEFYDYEAKYTHGMTEFILPARLSPETAAEVDQLSVAAFQAIGCRGYGRVDFMVAADETPYFTEINTLPGMTDLSDLPAQAREAGIGYAELVELILLSAVPVARVPA